MRTGDWGLLDAVQIATDSAVQRERGFLVPSRMVFMLLRLSKGLSRFFLAITGTANSPCKPTV